jgi:HAD superfamily hydrolase (TIGR01509 family)
MNIVVFDIGGVLANDMYNELLRMLLLDNGTSRQDFDATMKCADKAWGEYKIGAIDETEFFSRVVDGTTIGQELVKHGYTTSLEKNILVNVLKQKIRELNFSLFPDTLTLVEQVKQHMHVGILSNHTKEWIHELFSLQDGILRKLFDCPDLVVVSCDDDVTSAKPEAIIYEHLIRRIKKQIPDIKPEQVVFIDDKLRNVQAAQEQGIKGIHFDARKQSIQVLKDALTEYGVNV